MLPEHWKNAGRILVVRLDNIGDVIMAGPALRTLRAALPDARITFLASPAGSLVTPLLPWIDETLVHRPLWQDITGTMPQTPQREYELVQTLQARRFDAAVILTSFSQSVYPPAFICYLAGIAVRVGQSKEFGGGLLTRWVRALPDSAHQVDRNLFLLQSAGFTPAGTELELRLPGEARAAAHRLLETAGIAAGQPYILLAPGASCTARRYNPFRFARAVEILQKETGFPVVLAGNTRETELTDTIMNETKHRRVVSLAGKTTVPEFAALVGEAALVLSNNSSAMHFADAFRRPLVVLFTGVDQVSQYAPRYAPFRILGHTPPCSPCYRFECPYDMGCIDLSPQTVAYAGLELLEKHGTPGQNATTVSAHSWQGGYRCEN
jgi:ADP-heptose:LPS heptosyltransferase